MTTKVMDLPIPWTAAYLLAGADPLFTLPRISTRNLLQPRRQFLEAGCKPCFVVLAGSVLNTSGRSWSVGTGLLTGRHRLVEISDCPQAYQFDDVWLELKSEIVVMNHKLSKLLQRIDAQSGLASKNNAEGNEGEQAAMTINSLERSLLDGFHRHLDECAQCRNHPFDLCIDGALLIRTWWAVFSQPKPSTQGSQNPQSP